MHLMQYWNAGMDQCWEDETWTQQRHDNMHQATVATIS